MWCTMIYTLIITLLNFTPPAFLERFKYPCENYKRLAGKSPFSIGDTSSFKVSFPASHVSFQGAYVKWKHITIGSAPTSYGCEPLDPYDSRSFSPKRWRGSEETTFLRITKQYLRYWNWWHLHSRRWFQLFFMFTSIWGRFPILAI